MSQKVLCKLYVIVNSTIYFDICESLLLLFSNNRQGEGKKIIHYAGGGGKNFEKKDDPVSLYASFCIERLACIIMQLHKSYV